MTGIVWVPGHLCGAWLYEPQRAAFGPGTVADVESDDRIEAMAARLLASAPGRFVIAGLSMGGMVAMEAMAAAPERIAGAVLMDTDPFAPRERERAFRAEQRRAVEDAGLAAARPFVERFFAHDQAASARLLGPCLARMAGRPEAVYRAQADALDHRRDMVERLAAFPGPVAVVVGAEDRICPPKLHEPLAARLTAAELTVIPGTGHLATIEAPEAVNTAIRGLLARL